MTLKTLATYHDERNSILIYNKALCIFIDAKG